MTAQHVDTPTEGIGRTAAPALAIATAYLDAFTSRDFETVSRYLADGFTFDGPIAHYRSAAEFIAGTRSFVERLQPIWKKVAAFGDDREALLLYDLVLTSGATQRIADHYTVRAGKIQTETILWDTYGAR